LERNLKRKNWLINTDFVKVVFKYHNNPAFMYKKGGMR